MASLKLVCALVMYMMMSAQMAYALDCKEVINDLSPCEDYLFGSADKPSSSCCSGVKSLNNAASTKALRQKACNCMKSFAESYPSKINVNNAVSLAKKCEVKLPFTIGTPLTALASSEMHELTIFNSKMS